VIRRSVFLALGAAAMAWPRVARAGDEADPASLAQRPELRVLLGPGTAVASPGGNGFSFNGVPYRGSFVRLDDGNIVSVVGVEDYLYSVVAHEMSPGWPPAALQAQAVCSRTYVLQRSDPRRPYDLVPSQADQVYGGMTKESAAVHAAVDATAGQVLRYAGAFASVAYSSCCGGHTESSSAAWGTGPQPYLQGVVCTHCSDSPNYRWTTQLPLSDLANAFASQLAACGRLQDLRITATDASGRAVAFELVGDRGIAGVKGSTFRLAVGSRVLRSLLISNLHVDAGRSGMVELEGGGLGHGVGMCQWGARGMALAGSALSDILSFYFPGTELAHD
jgi:stage II sporulation protein D